MPTVGVKIRNWTKSLRSLRDTRTNSSGRRRGRSGTTRSSIASNSLKKFTISLSLWCPSSFIRTPACCRKYYTTTPSTPSQYLHWVYCSSTTWFGTLIDNIRYQIWGLRSSRLSRRISRCSCWVRWTPWYLRHSDPLSERIWGMRSKRWETATRGAPPSASWSRVLATLNTVDARRLLKSCSSLNGVTTVAVLNLAQSNQESVPRSVVRS